MPHTPKRPCRYPGCPNLCDSGVYCEGHRKEWSHDAIRGGAGISHGKSRCFACRKLYGGP